MTAIILLHEYTRLEQAWPIDKGGMPENTCFKSSLGNWLLPKEIISITAVLEIVNEEEKN